MQLWSGLVASYSLQALNSTDVKTDQRLLQLWKTIGENLGYSWDVKQLAELANITPEHLRRLCKIYFGRSPMRHLTHLRMQYAAMLLLSASYPVDTIAHKVGYDNSFAFSTAFKRFMKIAPSQYRKQPVLVL